MKSDRTHCFVDHKIKFTKCARGVFPYTLDKYAGVLDWPLQSMIILDTVKPVFFACPLFREFREPDKFAKITGRENLNTVAFQCSRKQKR